jgi:hypothetical protein
MNARTSNKLVVSGNALDTRATRLERITVIVGLPSFLWQLTTVRKPTWRVEELSEPDIYIFVYNPQELFTMIQDAEERNPGDVAQLIAQFERMAQEGRICYFGDDRNERIANMNTFFRLRGLPEEGENVWDAQIGASEIIDYQEVIRILHPTTMRVLKHWGQYELSKRWHQTTIDAQFEEVQVEGGEQKLLS